MMLNVQGCITIYLLYVNVCIVSMYVYIYGVYLPVYPVCMLYSRFWGVAVGHGPPSRLLVDRDARRTPSFNEYSNVLDNLGLLND